MFNQLVKRNDIVFKYLAIKKYGSKLLPTLIARYGVQQHYSASQIRSTIYQKGFNPDFLPLGYLLFLAKDELTRVLSVEFPELCIVKYKNEMVNYLDEKRYQGYLEILAES